MRSFKKLAGYCLSATVVGGWAISGWLVGTSTPVADSGCNDETSHRGSGRIVTWLAPDANTLADITYQGPDRLMPDMQELTISHRGSGRVDPQPPDSQTVSYRGTGRIAPNRFPTSKFG
jgi:hypothetical protein